jgi:imidazole glycerol-phosphate synthase subunit HisH
VIAVVDYGVNNVASVVRALAAAGHAAMLTDDPDTVRRADRLLLPGVGHFARARRNLAERGLDAAVLEAAAAGRPVMGICLGMQLCCRQSEEAPGVAGLGLLPADVARFRTTLHVPHVGWARVMPTPAGRAHPVTRPLLGEEGAFYYHVHSYHPISVPDQVALGMGDYDGPFVTLLAHENVLGAQFHPEKSQAAGIALLDGFARWTP